MVPSHGLLRSRVNRQRKRFESSTLVSEIVFECCFSELGTLRDLRSTNEMGQSCMRAIQKYFKLPEVVLGELEMRHGKISLSWCRRIVCLPRCFITTCEAVGFVGSNLCTTPRTI